MSDRAKNVIYATIALAALVVIGVGLSAGDDASPSDAERVDALAQSIKCPFCNGESLYESQSTVASEYRVLIAERVTGGATDEEVIAEFAANFGNSYILDTSTSGWSVALWIVPALAIAAGISVIVWLYRSAQRRVKVSR